MYLLKVLSFIHESRFSVPVQGEVEGSGRMWGGGGYQQGVCVPFKALFLVLCRIVYVDSHNSFLAYNQILLHWYFSLISIPWFSSMYTRVPKHSVGMSRCAI